MPDLPCRTAHAGAIPADPSPPPFPMTAATATLQFHPQRRPMEPVADPIVGDRVELLSPAEMWAIDDALLTVLGLA